MENLRNANSRFALDLFGRFNETNPTGNVFFSPVSVSAALAMVLLGAKGNTKAQVLKVSKNIYIYKISLLLYILFTLKIVVV